MYNNTNCVANLGNTGLQKFCGNIGKHRILMPVPKGTEIATKTLALTLGTYETNINNTKALRWLPFPPIVNAEFTQEDNVKQEFDFGYTSDVRDGKLTVIYTLDEMSTYNKSQLAKLNSGDFDLFIATDKEYIEGYSVDGIIFRPFTVDYMKVLPETPNTGTEVAHVRVEVKFSDVNQMNLNHIVVNPTKDSEAPSVWYPTIELVGIKDLVVSANTGSASGFNLVLAGVDGVPYSAAVSGDVLIYKSTAPTVAIACTGLIESATAGTYAATWATQTAGTFTISLKNQPLATTKWVETPSAATLIWV